MVPKLVLIAGIGLSLSACQQADDLNGRSVTMSGAGVVYGTPSQPIEDTDLAALIKAATPTTEDQKQNQSTGASNQSSQQPPPSPVDLQQQIGSFGKSLFAAKTGDSGKGGTNDPEQLQNGYRYARNQVLGYIIAASNNRCDAFKLLLRQRSSNISFGLGSLATSLGAAGALFSHGTSQIFSGLSGATSGINAEYNKDIMSSLTSSVIIPGIDKQRASILQEIMNRRCLGLPSYSLTQAMADGVKYHAACSTDVGVAAAGSALSQSNKLTLADAQTAASAVKKINATLSASPTTGTSGKTKPKAANAAGAAPKAASPSTQANTSGTQSSTDRQTASTPLLGDPLSISQCPTLDANGLLPDDKTPSGSESGKSQVSYDMP